MGQSKSRKTKERWPAIYKGEEKDTPVVVISHKRAARVKTSKIVSPTIIAVEESQAAEYREHNPDEEIVTHPDSVLGLSEKRQWTYEHFGDHWQLNDDLKAFSRCYLPPSYGASRQAKINDPELVYDILQMIARTAKQIKAYVFGVAYWTNEIQFSPFRPLRLGGLVNGNGFGIFDSPKLAFNTDIQASNDFYITLINAYYHRYCYIDTRFAFHEDKMFADQEGGLSGFRTMASEKKDMEILQSLFGTEVVELKLPKTKVGKQNPNTKKVTQMRHQWQKRLRIPF